MRGVTVSNGWSRGPLLPFLRAERCQRDAVGGVLDELQRLIGTVTYRYTPLQSGANETLSVEYLMDCNTVNNGCGGGLLDDSWQFMAKTGA